MTGARRILAFSQDAGSLEPATRLLAKAGAQVQLVKAPAELPAQLAAFKPELIVMDRTSSAPAVGEAIALLREVKTPLVFLLESLGERELIRALQAHAVEVLQPPLGEEQARRLLQLAEELERRPQDERLTWEDRVARNFVDLARRHQLRGTLLVNRGTPFEGRVVLKDGVLARASYGPLSGMEAVREILQLEDGSYELDASLNLPAPKIAHSAVALEAGQTSLSAGDTADLRPRLLAVDDEPHLLALVSRFLTGAGFEVSTAVDGLDAVEKAREQPFDLIVADLSMPRMDGWEMLKTLKADRRTSEIPVVFLSAHDDYREALRSARAGAHDYLAKTGRNDQVVAAALKAITPRLEAVFGLLVGEPVEVRTQAIGFQWLLRALERIRCTGVLDLKDDWGRYRVGVVEGRPISAQADVQQRRVTGLPAFVRMMVAGAAQGTFAFTPPPDPGAAALHYSMEDLIRRGCDHLNAAEDKSSEQKLASAAQLDLDPELYELFCRIAPARKVAFAQAVCERRMPLDEVAASLKLTPEQGTDWFRELLRREVLTPASAPRGKPDPSRPWTPNELRPELVKRRERQKAVVDDVRAELGEEPWGRIAVALATDVGLSPGRELTLPDLVKFAAEHGFAGRDVLQVIERITAFGALQRLLVHPKSEPGQEPPEPAEPEVTERVRAAFEDDRGRAAWEQWAGRAKIVWRITLDLPEAPAP